MKKRAKKMKKTTNRVSNVSDVLENFSIGGQDYDFDDDYKVE
jgi:hypothetical protein